MNDSSLARLVGVLFSPGRTFELIRQRPTWLVALVVLVLLGTLSGYLISDRLDWEDVTREQLAQSSRQLSEEQIEQSIAFTESFAPKMVIVGPLLGGPVIYLLIALLYWVLLRLLGGELTYKASFATTLHGLVPSAGVAVLLGLPVILSRGELSYDVIRTGSVLASNLGSFAPEETSTSMLALLSSVDVFSIWSLILLSIGFAVVARVSRAKAASAIVGLWAVYVLFKIGAAAIQG